ncbi:MAG: hypothetical protein ACYSYW_14015 [Planctomycetota bacterium]
MRKHVLSIGMALMLGILTLAACGPAANDNPDVAGLPTDFRNHDEGRGTGNRNRIRQKQPHLPV